MDRKAKRDLMARLERDAQRICARFRLKYRVLEPERANVKRRYGVCFSDGTIRIRLTHVTTRRPLKYSSLVNTLCHELAHLRHFNHGPQFQAFYATILEWARREGIYRPGATPEAGAAASRRRRVRAAPGVSPGPIQLDAFRLVQGEVPARSRRPSSPTKSDAPRDVRPAQLDLFG